MAFHCTRMDTLNSRNVTVNVKTENCQLKKKTVVIFFSRFLQENKDLRFDLRCAVVLVLYKPYFERRWKELPSKLLGLPLYCTPSSCLQHQLNYCFIFTENFYLWWCSPNILLLLPNIWPYRQSEVGLLANMRRLHCFYDNRQRQRCWWCTLVQLQDSVKMET